MSLLEETNEKILSHGGKLLRPMLSLLVSRALGTPNDDSIRYAAGAELLHNATLMHDDVADESSERRGMPTVSAMLGPSAAVLVGDFWLARAVELVIGSNSHERVIPYFSKTLTDLAEGEMLQLEKASTADTDEQVYYRIIYCKTASLFVASVVSAADSVNAPQPLFDAARSYAEALGVAFQIKDDILDYAGTQHLGKPVGVDLKEKKITLPLLGAMKRSEREQEIRDMVREIDSHPENVDAIRRFVEENDGIGYASARLDEYIRKAEAALESFPESRARQFLVDIARYNAFRTV